MVADSEGIQVPEGDEARTSVINTWGRLVAEIIDADPVRGAALVLETIEQANAGDATDLAVRAAATLLARDPSAWEVLEDRLRNDEAFGRLVALDAASPWGYQRTVNHVDSDVLASMYRWLIHLFPPDTDPEFHDAHFVGPDEQARSWRDSLIRALVARETHQALGSLVALSREFPARLGIRSGVLEARSALYLKAWRFPSPSDVVKLFADAARRLVRSEAELVDLVIETLDRIRDDLHTHCDLLWDRRVVSKNVDLWSPKLEASVSAYLAHEMVLRLQHRGIVVNREVLVSPTNAYGAGNRTDILVSAARHGAFGADGVLNCVVEVKGMWNAGLLTDQRDQLAGAYLPETASTSGVYVVSWYRMADWTDTGDSKRRVAKGRVRAKVVAALATQADDILASSGLTTATHVLDVPFPKPRKTPAKKSAAKAPAKKTAAKKSAATAPAKKAPVKETASGT